MAELMRRFARRDVAVRFAVVALSGIAALAVLGALHTLAGVRIDLFDPNGERNVQAFVAAGLLATAGAAALVAASVEEGRPRLIGYGLAGLLTFLSADELLQLHEKAERLTGVDWQKLYLPIFAVGGVLGALMLRRVWPHVGARVMLVAAGAAWFVAELLEAIEYDAADGRVASYDLMVVIEEPLEMTGSALITVALILGAAMRRRARAEAAAVVPARPERAPTGSAR